MVFFRVNPENDNWKAYNVWGVTATEVEVDVLTGEMYIVRTDLLQDAGLATNPNVRLLFFKLTKLAYFNTSQYGGTWGLGCFPLFI